MQVSVLVLKEQLIHYYVTVARGSFLSYVTIVYAKNNIQERVEMWEELKLIGASIQEPWLLSGDFNSVLSSID